MSGPEISLEPHFLAKSHPERADRRCERVASALRLGMVGAQHARGNLCRDQREHVGTPQARVLAGSCVAPLQRRVYGALPGWLPATAIRCLLPACLIVALFYGYISLLGGHHLLADIAIFVLAILAGEILGHAALGRACGPVCRMATTGLLAVATVLFATLSFWPPDCFLFQVPVFPAAG